MANVKIDPVVHDILNRSTITGNTLSLPPGQLDRPVYEAVYKAIKAAGGKWNKKAGGHVFVSDPRERLGLALKSGVMVDEKKKFQAFFTPVALADRLVEMADIHPEHGVLEPSAGHGAIAEAVLRRCHTPRRLLCCEANGEFVDVLVKKGLDSMAFGMIVQEDFLAVPVPRSGMASFDRIVMNPPFTKNQDIKHVAHALKFLNPGGRLVAIMSPNVERPAFRQLCAGRRYHLTPVDPGAFKESGTNIATVILVIDN